MSYNIIPIYKTDNPDNTRQVCCTPPVEEEDAGRDWTLLVTFVGSRGRIDCSTREATSSIEGEVTDCAVTKRTEVELGVAVIIKAAPEELR